MTVRIISAIVVLALSSLACGVTVDLPNQSEVGADVTESITVAEPDAEEAHLSIEFGAGDLTLSTGAKDLVEGTAVYNVADLQPEIIQSGDEIEIKQGEFQNLPPFNDIKNEWDLKLGQTPMDLEISAGAYDGVLELGGLSLNSLMIRDGASNVELAFSEPNLVEMSELRYTTGASEVRLEGLANANFSTFVFNSGAGEYVLDFSGDLQRDATVSIDCGFSDLTLIIPQGVHAVVTIDKALADIQVDRSWSHENQTYTQAGEGPTLTILVNMSAGEITLRD